MDILMNLIRTIFMDLLALVGGVAALAILGAILQSFIDATESRRRVTRVLGSVAMAMCAAAVVVVIVQVLRPIINPKSYIDMLTTPTFYGQ